MKRWIAVVTLAALLLVMGCSGVSMNAEYSRLLDDTVIYADDAVRRVDAGEWTPENMTTAIHILAKRWHRLQDARDGVAGEVAK